MEENNTNEPYTEQHYLHVAHEGDSRSFDLTESIFSKTNTPSFTIFAAPAESKYISIANENQVEEQSNYGHVFLGITGFNPVIGEYESVTIGFSAGESMATSEDNISFNDHLRYPEASSITVIGNGPNFDENISSLFENYNKIKNKTVSNESYNLLFNNCVDFVDDFLEKSNIKNIKISGSPNSIVKRLKEIVKSYKTPIIIDLNGDGVKTLPYSFNISFEFNGEKQITGWVEENDGFLVIDKNNDSIINNASELFGENTLKLDGNIALNGFEALVDLDCNSDKVIDKNDLFWTSLQIWQDKNSDGETQSGELLWLDDIGISSIDLDFNTSEYIDQNNNQHRLKSTVKWNDNRITDMTDVWLEQDSNYSVIDFSSVECFNLNGNLIEYMVSIHSDSVIGDIITNVKIENKLFSFAQARNIISIG